jgi:pilus assembly protein CpaE
VLYDAQDEGLALRAMRAGAADYLLTEACGHSTTDSITLVIRSAVGWGRKLNASRKVSETARPGGAIAFMGSKGGVGATTVALNIAAVLAKHSTVILVEMRPAFGSLLPYLMPFGRIRNISQLLRSEAKEVSAAEAGACLWPCKNVPGLSVLFGPQLASECVEFAPDRVTSLIKMLAGLADFVVLDLPPSLSEANRAAVEAAGRLLVVSERDPVCVQAAKLMIQSMQAWPGTPPIEVILVNRSAVSCPMPLSDIEAQLGFPAIGLVPPGPEICLAAQQAHVPLIEYQAESLIADSLSALADKCASRLRTLPSWPDGSRGSSREALASAGVMHAE